MQQRARIEIEILSFLALVLLLSVVFYFVTPQQLVAYIGIKNIYIVMFFIALLGGSTSIGAFSYAASILAFVDGGANPLFIGIAAGGGTAIGDSLYYIVSRRSVHVLKKGWLKKKISQSSKWLRTHDAKTMFVTIYLYASTPVLPNDILTVTLGLSRAKNSIVIPALVLGDFTLALLLAFLGHSLPAVFTR